MVQIDDDIFIDMLWERVNNGAFDNPYSDEFWMEAFDRLKGNGWMGDPQYNDPKYIIDNIIVNGEIVHKDDVEDDYDLEGKTVEEWIKDNGYEVVDDYVIINWVL